MKKALYLDNIGVEAASEEAMAVGQSGGRPVKRQRRRVTAEIRDFRSFPSEAELQIEAFKGPFRVNVKDFLSPYAWTLPSPPEMAGSLPQVVTWRMPFSVRGEGGDGAVEREEEEEEATVDLEVVIEDVAKARAIHCDQCRVVGWSGNPVCAKRYHFIIRNDGKAMVRTRHKCARCESSLDASGRRCMTCNFEMSEDDMEDWTYQFLEDNSHLLHAVVHSNGYGHLLRVNGREGGSKFLSGRDIMGFWDRLCRLLRVRKVTVMDISKKYGLEYRLLHAITAGRPWYGEWGYEFGTGSYAITARAYEDAIDTLSRLPISLFFSHSRSPRSEIQDVIAFYRFLCDQQLLTVGDVFRFMLQLIHEARLLVRSGSATGKKPLQASRGVPCAWTAWALEDVKLAEEAIVRVLRAVADGNWVSQRALRGALCHSVGSSELLDYCLKGLGGKITGDGTVVAVRCNADTYCMEYRLEAFLDGPCRSQVSARPSEDHVIRDLNLLYNALLNPYAMGYKPDATRERALKSATVLLDCKRFIKNYDREFFPSDAASHSLYIWCETELRDQPKDQTAPPPELLVLPETATVALLKLEAIRAFQEVYIAYQRFEVDKLIDDEVCNSTNVKLLIGKFGSVKVKGRCPSDNRLAQFRMERGTEKWVVDCLCGAEDDDGERMVACDECGVWTHTRCIGVSDVEEVPKKYVCMKCSIRLPSGAKALSSSRMPPSNKRPKRVNNETINVTHVSPRSMHTLSDKKNSTVANDKCNHFIKRNTDAWNEVGVSGFVPSSSLNFNKVQDCDMEKCTSLEVTKGDLITVVANNTSGRKINESCKYDLHLADACEGIGGVHDVNDMAPFTKGKDAIDIVTEDTHGDHGLRGEASSVTDDIRKSNGWCNDEMAGITNTDTDRGRGRCKDGMASPITEVGMHVTMTCK